MMRVVPGERMKQMVGEGAASVDIQAARHAYGLDVPLGQQYNNYWKGVLHADLGRSIRFCLPVTTVIKERYPQTMQLTLAALIVALALSIPSGLRSHIPPTPSHHRLPPSSTPLSHTLPHL